MIHDAAPLAKLIDGFPGHSRRNRAALACAPVRIPRPVGFAVYLVARIDRKQPTIRAAHLGRRVSGGATAPYANIRPRA